MMKTRTIVAGLASILAACNPSSKTADFIPGTYVNHAESAYSVANDTLAISADRDNANVYHIVRRTGFRRKKERQVPQYQVKTFIGIWSEQQQILQISQNGVLILFHPDKNELSIENSTYLKLKK
ncbi:hypothetical protein [Mucilaginibacter gossypiicola]|nr:hypothetical protein [Mucilaginibacter gossypiicola]